jgi:hypothetical protein
MTEITHGKDRQGRGVLTAHLLTHDADPFCEETSVLDLNVLKFENSKYDLGF